MEALSPTMEEGQIVQWLKNEGDAVAEGDVIAEIETDKATMELVARGSGVLRKQLLGPGASAAVGTVIGVIAGADEDVSALMGGAAGGGSPEAASPVRPADAAAPKGELETSGSSASRSQSTSERGRPTATTGAPAAGVGEEGAAGKPSAAAPARGQQEVAQPAANGGDQSGRVKASPLARRLAADAGLDLTAVSGSGPGGRIVKRDVEAAAGATGAAAAGAATPAAAPMRAPAAGDMEEIRVSQMRKTIAKRLVESIGPVPTFYLTIEVDMTRTSSMRESLNERLKDSGAKVSLNDLVIKATAAALRRHPEVNSAWAGDVIRRYHRVDIGVAVAVEDGLITPVVRNADQKGAAEIGAEVRELAGRAREKKLQPDEYTGATFSVSNLGMFGIDEFTAIINPPEAAILAIGRVEEKPVFVNGRVAAQPRMRITMSCDHRVIDGATGAKFLQTLRSYLEEPMMMLA